MSKAGTQCPRAPEGAAYARGFGAAGRYLGWRDPQGRKFKEWAAQRGIKFNVIGGSPVFRLADLDLAWRESPAQIIPVFSRESAMKANAPAPGYRRELEAAATSGKRARA